MQLLGLFYFKLLAPILLKLIQLLVLSLGVSGPLR